MPEGKDQGEIGTGAGQGQGDECFSAGGSDCESGDSGSLVIGHHSGQADHLRAAVMNQFLFQNIDVIET